MRQCCAQEGPDAAELLHDHMNWDVIFRLATHHRALPAVYTRLQSHSELTASIRTVLRARFTAHCQRVLRFSGELAAILEHFELRGIPAIAHKGPVLAHMLYGDAAMREFGDLDLLIRPADVTRAVRALRELGYQKQLDLSPRQEQAYLRSGYEYVFGCGIERNLVELQWQILPRFYAVEVRVKNLFERCRDFEFEGVRARVLCREDLILVLCLHAAKHQWAQLGMIRDIAAFSSMKLDWDWIFREARRLGISRILILSLLLAERLLGTKIPADYNDPRETAECDAIASKIKFALEQGREPSPESMAYFRFMLQIRERWRDRARFLWRLVVTPSVGEWKAVQLPDVLFPLYSGVRAFRLTRKLTYFAAHKP